MLFQVKKALGNQHLYGLINNAGTGFEHKVSDKDIIDTNFYGPKRVCDNFIKLLDPTAGRIVNIGSHGGPEFVSTITDLTVKKQVREEINLQFEGVLDIVILYSQMCSASTSWAELEVLMERFLGGDDFGGGTCYDLSKAGLMVYTMQLAAQYPNLKVRNDVKNWLNFQAEVSYANALRYLVSTRDLSVQTCPRDMVPQSYLMRAHYQP